MGRLLRKASALFFVALAAGYFFASIPTTLETKAEKLTQIEEARPYLSAVSTIPNSSANATVAISDADINARFTGMLLHLKWLLKNGKSSRGGASDTLFDKQVESLSDDFGSGLNDLREELLAADSALLAIDTITPDMVLSASQTDEYCLTYEGTGDTWEWQTCGSGGGMATTDIDTSAELRSIMTDETGTGALVFAGSPTLTGTLAAAAANFSGNLGVATTSPWQELSVNGDFVLTGRIYDSLASAGASGMVLQTTGSAVRWVATSTLGISGGGSLFTDGGTTTYLTASDNLGIGTTTANQKLTIQGSINLSSATGAIYFDDTRFLYASSTNHIVTFGENAGENIGATDLYNIAFGYQAGRSADSNYNIFAGTYAGYNSSGQHNYLFGYNAGYNNNGAANVIMGPDAGYNNLGGNNFIFGDDAGYNNAGTENFIYGTSAGYSNSGSSNFILGASAGYSSTGSSNLFIGEEAGYNNGGSGNILLGYHVANNLTSGNHNIVIGYDIDSALATTSNSLNIGNLIFGTGLDGTGTTLSSGNIGIGSTSPSSKLTVQNTGSGNSFIVEDQANDTTPFMIDASGNVGIGTATPDSDYIVDVEKTSTLTSGFGGGIKAVVTADSSSASSASFGHDISSKVRSGNTSNYSGYLYGLYSGLSHSGTGVIDNAEGTSAFINKISTGSIVNAKALNAYLSNYSAGGSITTAKILNLELSNSGTIGSTYGLYLGDLTAGTQTNTPYAIFSSDAGAKSYLAGNLGIGTTTPAQELQVFGDIRVGTTGSNGCIEDFGGGVIGGTCSSDQALKENVEPIAQEGKSYLAAMAALTPVTYNWNDEAAELYGKNTNIANLGLIAQDVEQQFPELVSLNDDGYRQVDFRALPFYLIEALKELWEKVQGHDARLQQLEQENDYLKERIENIENELDINPAPAPTPEPESIDPEPVPPEENAEPETVVIEENPVVATDVETTDPPEESTYVLVPAAPTE